MNFFSDDEKAKLAADFDNCTVEIFREGASTPNNRGVLVAGAPVVVLASQSAQEWDLTSQQQTGLSGEEIRLRKNLKLHDYHLELTEKLVAVIDGIRHNILLCGHDGSKSHSILLLKKVTG